MTLYPCRECGREISTEARACPQCGALVATTALTRGEQDERLRRLLSAGSKIIGPTAATATGLLVGGVPGALAAAAMAAPLTDGFRFVGLEIERRLLGPREYNRIGGALGVAVTVADRNLKRLPASDRDGFQIFHGHEVTANEVIEGVLLTARDEAEERKIEFYGRMLGNLAFRGDISRARANQLLHTASELTYRQLRLLALFYPGPPRGLRSEFFKDGDEISPEVTSVYQQTYDLCRRGLVELPGYMVTVPGQVQPSDMITANDGRTLVELMELSDIPASALADLEALLGPDSDELDGAG